MTDFVQQALDSISDRTDIDWPTLDARSTGDETHVIVQCLRDISSIARAHSIGDRRAARSVPFEWGSLQVLECIAHGVHGDVYGAWDPRLEREVALKLLHDDTDPTNHRTPAIVEGRLLARVRHPNVVTVYGADRIDGQSGIWMEFLHGRTLCEEVERNGPLSAAAAIRAGLEISGDWLLSTPPD